MQGLTTKSAPAEFKVDASSSDWLVEGYASTFENEDSYGDIIKPGAFKRSIRERFKKNRIKVLWEHWEPFGMPIGMEEDEKGLFTQTRVSKTDTNRERIQYMVDGVVDMMSIGFTIPEGKSKWSEDYSIRTIKEVVLYEYSMVMFPANELAAVSSVQKHAQLAYLLEHMDREKIAAYAKSVSHIDAGRLENALDALTEISEALRAQDGVIPPDLEGDPDGDNGDSGANDGDNAPDQEELVTALRSFQEELTMTTALHDLRRGLL